MKRRSVIIVIAVIIMVGAAGGTWAYQHFGKKEVAKQNSPNQPQHTPASKPKPYVDQVLAKMALRDKVASLFILHTPGTGPADLATYLTTYKPGGLIFMSDNISGSMSELRATTNALVVDKQLPPFLAVDEEGDTVKRFAADTYPGALTLPGKPPVATKEAFIHRSDLLKSVGLNLNFGIIADFTANPYSFIFPRVLGTTSATASERVAQAVEGSKGRTLSTLKHFPGHGETSADSHSSIPAASTSYTDWKSRVSLPFKAGIDAGADLVMLGHLRYTAVDQQPATLSKKWHDVLRNELDFKGLTITDDMIMLQNSGEPSYIDPVNNAIAALQADNDLLLYVLDHGGGQSLVDPEALIGGVVAAVQDGRLNESDIDERARKVLTVRHQLLR